MTKPEYHQSGKLNRVTVKLKNETDFAAFVSSITYNPKGQREKIVYGNSTETEYTYERETFRLTGLTTTRTTDNRDLQDITYTYDPVGNITEIIDNSHHRVFNAGHIIDPENEFVYDALYRLTEAQGREHLALNNPLQSNFDQFKQSLFTHINDTQNLGLYTQNYSYDKAGNLTQIRHLSTGNSSRNYTRNMVVASGSNRAIPDSMGTDVAPYFDMNGNMTALEHLVGIDWNYRDNISKATIISRPGATDDAEYYVYNSAGQRVRKVKETLVAGNTEIEEKIYLGSVEIKRIRTGSLKILERSDLHVMDDRSRIAIVNYWAIDTTNREVNSSADLNTNKIRYQYGNHLGSASLELNATGQIISYEEYFPYGGTSFTTGDNQKEVKLKEYRYTGKERDDSTGLYYYGARYYASWLGRWVSADPKRENTDGLNLYAYVKGNPIILIDPNGEESNDAHIKLPKIFNSAGKISKITEKIGEKIDKKVNATVADIQNKIDGLDEKTKNGEMLTFKDKLFLSFVYNSIVAGGLVKGMPEASKLMDRYLNKNGDTKEKPFMIDSDVYSKSEIVKYSMGEMKKTILKDLKDKKLDNHEISSVGLLKNTPKRNVKTEGRIIDNGILLSEQNNKRLKNTDNRFALNALIDETNKDELKITWSVLSKWDYEPYSSGKNYMTELPWNREKGQVLKISDGLSNHLTTIDMAREFWYKAEWTETWKLK